MKRSHLLGTLTASCLLFTGTSSAVSLFGYAGRDNILYSINTDTVTATVVGANVLAGTPSEIEHDMVGTIFAADTGDNTLLHSIDPATGLVSGTTTMTFPTGGDVITAMQFVGSTLYGGFTTEVAPGGPTSLVTIDTTTGGVSVVGATGIGTPLGGLAFDGATMYAVTAGGSVGELYTIDLLSGTASLVGPTGFGMTALEFGSDGVLYGLPNQRPGFGGHLLSINTLTGAGTDLGDLGIFNLNALTSPIPIPPAVWLFGSGLLGLIGVSRRKKSA